MRSRSNARFRFALLAPLVGAILALVAVSAPAAQASLSIESFFSANCKTTTCTAKSTEEHPSEFFTQAAGHPTGGITDFKIKSHVIQVSPEVAEAPEGNVKTVRTNVAPGVSTNPEAVKKCSISNFTGTEVEPVPHVHAFTAPNCPETEIGANIVHVVFEVATGVYKNYVLEGKMYNLEQPTEGLSSYFGIALSLEPILGVPLYVHTFLEGHVEWGAESPASAKVESQGTGKADYHDYYVIKNITPGLIESRVIFDGTAGNTGNGGFVTNPSVCSGIGPQTTTGLQVESYEGEFASETHTGPVGTEGCNGASPFKEVPFAPTFGLTPEKTQSDQPDGITTELTLPHAPGSSEEDIDSSQLKTASITLPEGLTLNPSAASGLQACTPTQIGIKTKNPIACPTASKIGEVTLTVPDLPAAEPLTGSIYLGGPESGPIAGPPYTMYINAESTKYDVDVRLKGSVTPNETTGRLTATFSENPEQPFSNIKLKFNGGPLAPLANPLVCGTATTETSLSPFTGTAAQSPMSSFVVDGNNAGGACASSLPFALTQTTQNQNANAGGNTSFTFNLSRPEGQQYLSQVKTTLPPGLVALLPTVTPCGEEQANAGTCPASSQVGAAAALAGSGPTPFLFTGGTVYLTGPYNGAPYGLSIVVPAVAGPFSLGNVVTRATINVDPITARVTVTSVLPTIHAGIPLRLRGITVAINKQGYLINPTNCSAFLTESTLTSTFGTTQTGLNSPFQVNNCGALSFKPSFKAKTSAKTSKANGASLETTINIGNGQTNFKSVMVQLPKQLPSRLTTLQKACPESVFATNPFKCPSGSFVGGARANTPTLPGKLQGPAILVSHAGLAFPDLDLVMEANGVKVILVGNTKISKGITTTTFASTPDVPVSSITVNLPIGGHSALTANGNLCINPLTMPTTMIAQNGFKVTQKTKLTVASCPVRIAGKKVVGNTAYITVQTYSPGRISGSGSNLKTVYRKLGKAEKTATLKVPLSNAGLRRGKPLKVKLRVGFVPKTKSIGNSASTTTVVFG
jgi:hypothetical protein